MTVGRARSFLSILWVVAVSPLFLLFIAESVLGKYGDEWDAPWNWFIPLVGPILTLIVSVCMIDAKFYSNAEIRSKGLFNLTMLFSILYIVALYLVVGMYPLSDLKMQTLFRSSGWYLGTIQVFVVLTLHRFFLENVDDNNTAEVPRSQHDTDQGLQMPAPDPITKSPASCS